MRVAAYCPLIGMHMSCKYEINFVLDEPRLIHHPHGFTFHVVIVVAIVPWSVHEDDQPWCFTPVDLGKLSFKPLVLRSVLSWKRNNSIAF